MSRAAVAALAPILGAGLLIAACGSTTGAVAPVASSTPTASRAAPTVVQAPCGTGRVTVPVGGHVDLHGCAAGVTARATDTRLRQVAAADFEAVAVGASGITLSAGPSCSAGTLCPQYVRFVGVVSVTVTTG